MVQHCKINIKLSSSQLNKFKTAAKNQAGVSLRMNIKMFNGNNLPRTKLRNKVKKCI